MRDILQLVVLGTLVLGVHNSMIHRDGFNLPKIDDWWGTEESKNNYDTSIRSFEIKFEKENDTGNMRDILQLVVLGTLVLGVHNSMIHRDGFNLPKIDDWWGTEESKNNYDTSIRSFEIKFEKEMIADLKERLNNHRIFTPPLKGVAFHYGFNTDNMEPWIDFWVNDYNFTEREAFMNQFPHYKTNIQGLDMHFIWVKPDVPKGVTVLPMLLLHGWPGSIREFYSAIPLLTAYCEKRGFALEVIVPSLPGFGYSGAAVRKGLGATEMAVVFRNLMHRLGFEKFYIQGGDWGAQICNSIATLFPDEVLGYHTNLAISFSPSTFATWFFGSLNKELQSLVVDASLAGRLYPITTILKGLITETGYLHMHATKPDTIGVAMSDSPSGLLAYILQSVSMMSNSEYIDREDGGLHELYPPEELIDNLMVYWVNNAFTTAIRIYAETLNSRNVEMKSFALSTPVPTCTVHAKSELLYQAPSMLKYKYTNHLNATILEDGGHFLAMEKPKFFAENVLGCVELVRKWYAKRACRDEL